MIKELIKLATHLDSKGFTKEADFLDSVIEEAKDEYRPPVPGPTGGMYGGSEESRWTPMPKDMICDKVYKMSFELSDPIFSSMRHHCEDDPEKLEQCTMHAKKIQEALDGFLKFCSDDKMNIL
tara:strand:+ start:1289 stop:1657 length:369 start_codon:yes stop_codon:yes gene_type:complete